MTVSLDIANLERLYAQGDTTPEQIVREVYARIRRKGVQPDWIALVEEDSAIARARSAPRGPLYGIPFAVKDNIDVAGMPTTCACPEFAYVADRSATVVELLEQAGAVLIGKTNLDQFATGLNGTRSPYGIPTSTFNPDYISGGSSSGSAVAVAAGLVSFSLGTDTAGSGRVPAAFNNIVGLKPTKGLISMRGVVPACKTQDVVSIFALDRRRCRACRVNRDRFRRGRCLRATECAALRPLKQRRNDSVSAFRKADIPFFGDTQYESLYRASIDRMASLGADIIPIDYAPFAQAAAMLYARPLGRGAPRRGRRSYRPQSRRDPSRGAVHPARRARQDGGRRVREAFYRLADLIRAAQI